MSNQAAKQLLVTSAEVGVMGKWCGPPHERQFLCGAKAKSTGKSCKQFAMKNGRCYLHGGKSTGAKKPRIKHGMYTQAAIKERKAYREFMKTSNELLTDHFE
jgi:hypothetical protein